MRPPRDPGETLRLRKAVPNDGTRVLWLEEVCMKDYATALWGQWRPANTLETLDIANHEMVEWNGQPEGCLATKQTHDALCLTRLYIAPDARNRGVGAWVLGEVIDRANRLGQPIKLNVLTNNPAFDFYTRHGFIVQRETPERFQMIRPLTPKQKD